jgi:hypothetical protein
MGLETGSTISSFITSNPTSSDPVNQGDDHLRLIKSVLKAQFPGAAGNGFATAITATEAELNYVHGVTSNIQTQINNFLPSGTRMPFAQAAAPTGWTQDTSDNANNRMLRVVNTAGNGVGGSSSPILNNVVSSHTHTFTGNAMGAHSHSDAGHQHTQLWKASTGGTTAGGDPNSVGNTSVATGVGYANIQGASAGTPSGSISANGSASDWTPRYIDMIICSKN